MARLYTLAYLAIVLGALLTNRPVAAPGLAGGAATGPAAPAPGAAAGLGAPGDPAARRG